LLRVLNFDAILPNNVVIKSIEIYLLCHGAKNVGENNPWTALNLLFKDVVFLAKVSVDRSQQGF
jgi:hypothetical protein